MKNKIDIEVNFYQEGDMVLVQAPALELTTQGNSFEDARKMFEELLGIFFEENNTVEKLEKVLLECGWTKEQKTIVPPREIAKIYQTISLPEFV